MTPAEAEALGRRWREAKGDMERPGMRWIDTTGKLSPVRVVTAEEGVRITTTAHKLYRPSRDALDVPTWPDWVIDLRDPATRGAALEVVRERLNDSGIFIRPRGSKARPDWAAFTSDSNLIVAAPTEEEVLVAALESAPKETP